MTPGNPPARKKSLMRKIALAGLLVGTATPLAALMYADELVRAVTTNGTVPAPVDLPPGVEIRVAPRLTRIIGAPSGGASAVTVGRTIIIPLLRVQETQDGREHGRFSRSGDTIVISPALWREVVLHERVHVEQRERYGRWYLPLYVYWYLRRGYQGHPLEEEADEFQQPPAASSGFRFKNQQMTTGKYWTIGKSEANQQLGEGPARVR